LEEIQIWLKPGKNFGHYLKTEVHFIATFEIKSP